MLSGRPGPGLFKLLEVAPAVGHCLGNGDVDYAENASINCRSHAFQVANITANGYAIKILKFVNLRVCQFSLSTNPLVVFLQFP